MKKIILALWFLTASTLLAAPSDDERVKSFVRDLIAWSVVNEAPVEWDVVRTHQAEFTPEFFSLMEWVSTPHPDKDDRLWHYEVTPLWQVQASAVTEIKVGAPKLEKERWLVVVDFVSPSGLSRQRPPTHHHHVWVVVSKEGRLALEDIRYHIKAPSGARNGSVKDDMQKARNEFVAR